MKNVPHGVRYNNRYRGPQESIKVNSFYTQARYNINKLKKRIEYLELMKKEILEKPNNITSTTSSIGLLLNGIEDTVEKIISYESRHQNE